VGCLEPELKPSNEQKHDYFMHTFAQHANQEIVSVTECKKASLIQDVVKKNMLCSVYMCREGETAIGAKRGRG